MSIPLHDNQELVSKLSQFSTINELHRSPFFAEHQQSLRALLNAPQESSNQPAEPRIRDFLRVVHWNIERGNRFDGVLHHLKTHPRLSTADLLLLNELDVGMVRTGNRHIASDLGAALGYHVVYAPEYLELTKGIGAELDLSGENTTAFHGNAILSRFPLVNIRIVELPVCFEHFDFHEKRFGRRIAIIADLNFNGRQVTTVATHLEVRNTPGCRARQIRTILEQIAGVKQPVILGGDFNSNCFPRGTRWRTIRSMAQLLLPDPARVKRTLIHPDQRAEPLFHELERAGFRLWDFNTPEATAKVHVGNIEDSVHLPPPIRRWAMRRLAAFDYELKMRLDWICARGARALRDSEVVDGRSGRASAGIATIAGLTFQDQPVSDHDPIAADLVFE